MCFTHFISQDIAQEYEGTRDFALPFPTRGLYSERSAATVAGFSEELRKIIATYKRIDTYKTVRYEMDSLFQCTVNDDHIVFAISTEVEPIVHLLLCVDDRVSDDLMTKPIENETDSGIPTFITEKASDLEE
ncbi:hypothetical protein TELCIR_03244 [Teladorsagia circumcincta]|uniref:Uncharacterized protein n=1 Tax=Teladorsagia circumcincta TaxID=45464 RepID=A0A2G9UZ08_TELCI|nr:hypothetical protein TELCIR_03244 [Teladorsagia circumcincta]